jgi:hypothetical protein
VNAAEDHEKGTVHLIDNKITTDRLAIPEITATIETPETGLLQTAEHDPHISNKQDRDNIIQADIHETIRPRETTIIIQLNQIDNSDQILATDTRTRALKETDPSPEIEMTKIRGTTNNIIIVSDLNPRIHDHKPTDQL